MANTSIINKVIDRKDGKLSVNGEAFKEIKEKMTQNYFDDFSEGVCNHRTYHLVFNIALPESCKYLHNHSRTCSLHS